jgi:Helix-turn-helix domain
MSATIAAASTSSKIAVRFGDDILQEGFTAVPNLLLTSYAKLGITAAELVFIQQLWTYWRTENDPYPSLTTIARNMAVSWRQAHRYAKSLARKGYLIIRERYSVGRATNEYNFAPLLETLRTLGRHGKNRQEDIRTLSSVSPLTPLSGGPLTLASGGPLSELAEEIEAVETDKNQEEKDLSNLRATDTKKFDDELQGSNCAPQDRGDPQPKETTRQDVPHPQAQRMNQPQETEHSQSPPIHRNIEELEAIEKYRRSAAQLYVNSPPFAAEQAGHASNRAYQALLAAGLSEENVRDVLSRYVSEAAVEFRDTAPLKNSTTRAINLYRQSGLSITDFLNRFALARSKTKDRTQKKDPAQRPTSKMAYFFAVLTDCCGLRMHPPTQQQRS